MAQSKTSRGRDDLGHPRLYIGIELAAASWRLALSAGGSRILERELTPGDEQGLLQRIEEARQFFGVAPEAKVLSCHEAGRDGFWVHRFLQDLGLESLVVDAASIKVNRRARRRKTDRLDARRLLSELVRFHCGDDDAWRTARPPSPEAEDNRRLHRELERLKKERTQHRARILSLLATQGVRPKSLGIVLRDIESIRIWDGDPLPPALKAEITRQNERLSIALGQIRDIQREQRDRVQRTDTPALEKIEMLAGLTGIGLDSAWLLVMEFFAWRTFANRREVAGAAGLGGTPYSSGQMARDQGISKAGNARVRKRMVELAWIWVRLQPESKRTKWFNGRFAKDGKRQRRRGIVGVARMLLIDIWHFVEHGVVPPGATLKPALPR